jgi:hypothetical protein
MVFLKYVAYGQGGRPSSLGSEYGPADRWSTAFIDKALPASAYYTPFRSQNLTSL